MDFGKCAPKDSCKLACRTFTFKLGVIEQRNKASRFPGQPMAALGKKTKSPDIRRAELGETSWLNSNSKKGPCWKQVLLSCQGGQDAKHDRRGVTPSYASRSLAAGVSEMRPRNVPRGIWDASWRAG